MLIFYFSLLFSPIELGYEIGTFPSGITLKSISWTNGTLLNQYSTELWANPVNIPLETVGKTRMHSSRLRTTRLLTISQHALRRGLYPSLHWAGECVSQHALGLGLSIQGGVCLRGCLPKGVVCPRGLSTWGECVAETPGPEADTPLWTEWQTGVKTLSCCNFVAGGNKHSLPQRMLLKYDVSIMWSQKNCTRFHGLQLFGPCFAALNLDRRFSWR